MELNAIKNILEIIRDNKETKCEMLPLEYIKKDNRIDDKQISDAFKRLLLNDFMGSQYEWLGWFSNYHKGIELSIHEDDKAIKIINKYGRLKLVSDKIIGNYYILDENNSSEDVSTVFKNYHFPLAKLTKLDMEKIYLQWDCKNIMNMTWFCFNPINGRPCGICNPCKYSIGEGMRWRFTKMALLRYKLLPIKIITKGIYKKIIGKTENTSLNKR